jgi:glucokinase
VSADEIVVADIGGTHARFALASLGGKAPRLGPVTVLHTADYGDLRAAWRAFAAQLGRALPRAAAIAVAAPVRGQVFSFTNGRWRIARDGLEAVLGLDRLVVVNDFGAMAHAVACLDESELVAVSGPDRPLPPAGPISVIGPGTGLGVALAVRGARSSIVVETEGGHVAFAPLDGFEQALHTRLLTRHGRVSNERIVCGAGLGAIYDAVAAGEGAEGARLDDAELWDAAIAGTDARARAALDRFCLAYGSIAGDVALVHGAVGVALVGGLSQRMLERLRRSGFEARFVAKGRYVDYMSAIPVRLVTHPQPGLLGAAAAFASGR